MQIETEVYYKSSKKTTRDKRHYISSQLNTPECFLKSTRSHWLIENKLHWSLDFIFKEDQSRKRFKNTTENFSIILKNSIENHARKTEN
ncbi:ISAs1 family transposase [Lacinutrix neustonica]|uniref:ISAs1 family transposase n=1 Tax=Lacinutrix neustonica TaxID=2980107 RepID=UPI0036F30A22